MEVRMVHPEHGATHAYELVEIERLRKLGWSPEGEQPVAQVEPAELAPKKKLGRPPKAK